MTTDQAVLLIQEKLHAMEGKLDKKIDQAADTFASKLFWKMFPGLCVLVLALVGAFIGISYLERENNRKAMEKMSAANDKRQETLVDKIATALKKFGKNQSSTSSTSSQDDHSKEKSVSFVNYSTKNMKAYKVKMNDNGDVIRENNPECKARNDCKRLVKFLAKIKSGHQAPVFFDDSDGKSRLVAVPDGEESSVEDATPFGFDDSMWILKFDDVVNPKGLKTRDNVSAPKQ